MSDQFPDDLPEEDVPLSRTAIKKQAEALQVLGTQIVELSEKHIALIPLEGRLQQAIVEARKMKHREGRRRQLQFIGRLMREAPPEELDAIRQGYEKVMAIGQVNNQYFQQTERWRDRLLDTSDGNSLQDLIAAYPETDIQLIRQLMRNAAKEASQNKPPASARKLFKELRRLVEGV